MRVPYVRLQNYDDIKNQIRLGFIEDELAEIYNNYITTKATYLDGYFPIDPQPEDVLDLAKIMVWWRKQ